MKSKLIIKSYTLTPGQIATIDQVAKDNGELSSSAALRFIISEWVRMQRPTPQPIQEPAR